MQIPSSVDIAICGAGPVGLALAALLVKRGLPAGRIAVLDARALDAALADPRSLALSYGSRQILHELNAWPSGVSEIRQIHVSRRGSFGRTLIDCGDYDLPELGYVTRYGQLVAALSSACVAAGITVLRPAQVIGLNEEAQQVRLQLAGGASIAAGIVVQAEGGVYGEQPARPAKSIHAGKAASRDYAQTAIVAQVAASAPLPHRAFERFTDEGPLALLPQLAEAGAAGTPQGASYALVWCLRPASAQRLMTLSDPAFLEALQEAFGERVGRFLHVSRRSTYALGLHAEPSATERTVAIGNAAQTLHPVAGQGLNLGLRDASVLARLLAQSATPEMLPRFLQQRRPDRTLTIGLTDVMARIFASAPDGALTQSLLGLGLGTIDVLKPAKRLLAGQMMFGRR